MIATFFAALSVYRIAAHVAKPPRQRVRSKGLFSGMGSLIIALALDENLPSIRYIFSALLLGFIAYGLSIFTYIRAQKTLGAAKTSAYYAFTPFIGAFLSLVMLQESLSINFIVALFIMIFGTGFVIYDTLLHSHTHEHTHILTHTHNGTTHTHIVVHNHEHNHYINDIIHNHLHSRQELEQSL